MANVIRHKRGTSDPVAGDFSQTAELLVNTTDGGLFTKTDGGSVVEIGGDVAFNDLTGKTSGTGDYSTNADIVSGRGSGGVALTINDGYGNANVTWNHQNGVPEQNGNAARIEVNTDASTNAQMHFELKSGVTANSAVSLTNILTLSETQINALKPLDVTGNITVSGTVDGRDLAADGSKLDGIESGATADQTASEILTAIKTVDGSGSGLDADTLDGIDSGSFLRRDTADTATGAITFSGGQVWNSHITWNTTRNINISGESSFDVRSGGTWAVWDISSSNSWMTASYGQPLFLNNNALNTIVNTSSSSDYFQVRHRSDTDVTIDFYCESNTAQIADTFAGTTDKKYIVFSAPNDSSDPGYIMHETRGAENNEGVLHLCPSDDNAEGDYVSIHGTNDPDRIRLHTSGLIETVNSTDLYLRSGSGTIKTDDDIQLESSANLVFYDTNGTFPTAAGAFKWTLNNDSASIYAQQPQSDYIDFFFKITDNAGSTDRFVFWIDDYRGATYDKYPAHFDGSAQYLSVPVNGSGDKDLSNARFKVPFSGDVVIDGSKVWHAGNDGPGSGLDADTVDGIQGSEIVYGTAGAAVNALSATQNVYELGQYKAGFWDANGASWTPNNGWWWGATFAHRSNTSSYNYSGQLAFQNGNGGNGIYARTISNGTASSWSKLWSDGNDGPGSGLDADTVDGVHASSFFQANNALSATTGAFSGDVTMSGTGALKVANGTTAQRPTASNGQIRYNTTLGAIESYVQGAWQVIANTALDYGLITSASDTTFDYGALS